MTKATPARIQERIKELASQGKSTREIASTVGVSQSTAARVAKQCRTGAAPPPKGRQCILDKNDEKYICRLATTGKCSTATAIQRELRGYAGISASPNTIRRALRRSRIKTRYKKKRPQLSKSHRRARREFELSHRTWQDSDWDRVIWSDETKICLSGSDGRERTFRVDGEPLRDHHVAPTRKFGGGSIMVWGCMLSCGVGFLCRVDGGVDAEMYESILNDELMATIDWFGLDKGSVIFQQDNAPCHTASRIKKWLSGNGIEVMGWPAQSPDLNPIEHLWDHIKRKLKDMPPAQNLDHLWDQVQDIWNTIDSDTCLRLVRSMPKRLAAVGSAKGGYTNY